MWLIKVLINAKHIKKGSIIVIVCDNNLIIKIPKNPIMHGRSKHTKMNFDFVKDFENDEKIS